MEGASGSWQPNTVSGCQVRETVFICGTMLNMSKVRVNTKYQITISSSARRKLNIQRGDYLLMDIQDGMMILISQSKHYAESLAGLHGEVWTDIDTKSYLDSERDGWKNPNLKT